MNKMAIFMIFRHKCIQVILFREPLSTTGLFHTTPLESSMSFYSYTTQECDSDHTKPNTEGAILGYMVR